MEKKTITQVLSDIQVRLKAPKTQENKFGGYKYRSLEDIQEALKPLLAEHGAAVKLWDDIVQVGDRIYVKASAALVMGDDVVCDNMIISTAYAREPLVKKGMDESQITGAASSYARKYAMNGLFAIDDTRDADSTNDHGRSEQTQAQAPVRKAGDELGGEVVCINAAQVATINGLLLKSGILEEKTRMVSFGKRYLGGSSDVSKMPMHMFDEAVKMLEKVAAQKEGK